MRRGTAPAGVAGEEQAARWVRGMFGRVARRYDLLNHLLSFNMDRYWRTRTVRRLRDVLRRPGACVLDICCGSGDLTLALERASAGVVFGSDFCHPMLLEAKRKIERKGSEISLFEADALSLPAPDGTFDLVTAAFGFRNLVNYEAGLEEMLRVLKPGGTAAILEFSQPPNAVFRSLYNIYSRRLLPAVGGWISGSRAAYSYLPDSVKKFPPADELVHRMEAAGFRNVGFLRMTGGIVALHTGMAPE